MGVVELAGGRPRNLPHVGLVGGCHHANRLPQQAQTPAAKRLQSNSGHHHFRLALDGFSGQHLRTDSQVLWIHLLPELFW